MSFITFWIRFCLHLSLFLFQSLSFPISLSLVFFWLVEMPSPPPRYRYRLGFICVHGTRIKWREKNKSINAFCVAIYVLRAAGLCWFCPKSRKLVGKVSNFWPMLCACAYLMPYLMFMRPIDSNEQRWHFPRLGSMFIYRQRAYRQNTATTNRTI